MNSFDKLAAVVVSISLFGCSLDLMSDASDPEPVSEVVIKAWGDRTMRPMDKELFTLAKDSFQQESHWSAYRGRCRAFFGSPPCDEEPESGEGVFLQRFVRDCVRSSDSRGRKAYNLLVLSAFFDRRDWFVPVPWDEVDQQFSSVIATVGEKADCTRYSRSKQAFEVDTELCSKGGKVTSKDQTWRDCD